MHKLANTIVFTSQSIPFLHFGEELKRTKNFVENSYNSPDSINQINWDWKSTNYELFNYYKKLIQMRKQHSAFRLDQEKLIQEHLKFITNNDDLLIEYTINGQAVGDSWKTIYIAFNGDSSDKKIELPNGRWFTVLQNEKFDLKAQKKASQIQTINANTALIFIQK